MHIAVVNRQLEPLRLITDMVARLAVGDVLEQPNKRGSTALHLAAETGQV